MAQVLSPNPTAWRAAAPNPALRVALVNPAPPAPSRTHPDRPPLELAYARTLLERDGCRVLMLDALTQELTNAELAEITAEFRPDITAVAAEARSEADASQNFLDALEVCGSDSMTVMLAVPGENGEAIGAEPPRAMTRLRHPVLAVLNCAQQQARRSRLDALGARPGRPALRVIVG